MQKREKTTENNECVFRARSLVFQGLGYIVFSICVWGGLCGFWFLKHIPDFPLSHVLAVVVIILLGEWASLAYLGVCEKDKASGFPALLIGITGRTTVPFLAFFFLGFLQFQEKKALIVSALFAYFIILPFHVALSLRLVNRRCER